MTRLLRTLCASMGLIGLVLIGCFTPVRAASIRQQRESLELSLLVSGSIIINPDGSLRSYQINDASKLPPSILTLIARSAAHWRFEPVIRNGRAVAAKSAVTLRIVARQEPGNRYQLSIRGAQFGGDSSKDFASYHRVVPHYPFVPELAGFQAETYMALRINREGKVVDVAATQVNLGEIGPPHLMAYARKRFTEASIEACRQWTFKIAKGSHPSFEGYWIVLVPIDYEPYPGKSNEPAWQTYVPGQQQFVPWLPHQAVAASDIDAMSGSGIYDPQTALTLAAKLNRG